MVVGIDVAKAELVVAAGRAAPQAVPNNEAGVRELVERVAALAPELVVLEATGGYELVAVAALAAAALPVVVVNPRQVRDFAKATGQLARPTGSTHGRSSCSASGSARRRARCRTPRRRS